MLPENISDHYIAIVEGSADEYVFETLCTGLGIADVAFDSPCQASHGGFGKDFYYSLLQGLPAKRGFNRAKGIILIQDADDAPNGVLTSLGAQLRRVNDAIRSDNRSYGIPVDFASVVRGSNTPPVCAIAVPWGDRRGALETLIVEAIEDHDPALKECADSYIDCSGGLTGWTAGKKAKTQLACYVATRLKSNPTASIRNLLSSTEFRFVLSHAAFDPLRAFFSDLETLFLP
jgi:hypothetical protein